MSAESEICPCGEDPDTEPYVPEVGDRVARYGKVRFSAFDSNLQALVVKVTWESTRNNSSDWVLAQELYLVEAAPRPLDVGAVLTADSPGPKPPVGTVVLTATVVDGQRYPVMISSNSMWPFGESCYPMEVLRVGAEMAKCGHDCAFRPSWMSPGQYDQCPCLLPAGHDSVHLCEHNVADHRTEAQGGPPNHGLPVAAVGGEATNA